MAFNKNGSNWSRRQKDSIEFWMSVETGRQAAHAYRSLKSRGNRRADELAKKIIEKNTNASSRENAVKEFDFRKNNHNSRISAVSIDIDMIY